MVSLNTLLVVAVSISTGFGASGVKPSAISQFWMDDIKVLDQIYGKTSDKQLYGATLPTAINFNIDLKKLLKAQESQKKERYSVTEEEDSDSEEQFYPSLFGERYAKQFSKSLKSEKKKKSPLHFVGLSNFKPISESSDPETYNYLKHLEHFEKHKSEMPEPESYKSYSAQAEEEEAYRSIQDILDAHEANKGHKSESEFNDSLEKYPRRDPKDDDEKYYRYASKAVPTKSKVRFLNHNNVNNRCRPGRCRKRLSHYRSAPRPYIRKIKRIRIV
ncbi:unnamed protein product [Leptosia nina]|uniref:Uncharacterized protein n=1 Tax=Leptosia nina TaxID=320188 RepID=A0AAV1K3C8_9NEOP